MKNQIVQKDLMTDTYHNNLGVAISQFIVDRKSQDKSPNTIRFYQFALAKFVKYCEAHAVATIDQITPQLIREFYLYLKEEEGKKNGGILTHHRALKCFLNWYFSDIVMDRWANPMMSVRPPKKPNEIIDPVKEDQIQALIATCTSDTFPDQRDKAIIMLLAATGLRASELCAIEKEHINWGTNQIIIPHGKGNKARYVYFRREERLQLNRYLRHHSRSEKWVFTNQMGEKLVYNALRQIIRRRSKLAGVTGVECHDFRRYFTLKSVNEGMDLLTLSRILGHKDMLLLSIYAKQNPEDLQLKYKQVWERDR